MAKSRRRKSPARKSTARSELAKARPRGADGKFLTKAEIAALEQSNEVIDQGVVSVPESEPIQITSEPMSRSQLDDALEALSNNANTSSVRSGKSALERSLARHERRLRLDR